MWAFATLLYHVIQLSGGLGQALKQSAQRFKSMFWHKRDHICFTRDQICGGFMGLWAKTERFWIGGMRQKDVWHLKFRNSEICVRCHVSEFQFQKFDKLKKIKGLGRILPSGRGLPHHQSLLSELRNPPWFRSIDLRFGCCGFWFGSRLLGEFFARICRAWFLNCARIREFVEFGSGWKCYSSAGCF